MGAKDLIIEIDLRVGLKAQILQPVEGWVTVTSYFEELGPDDLPEMTPAPVETVHVPTPKTTPASPKSGQHPSPEVHAMLGKMGVSYPLILSKICKDAGIALYKNDNDPSHVEMWNCILKHDRNCA